MRGSFGVSLWKTLEEVEMVRKLFSTRTKFWQDIWVGESPLTAPFLS